MSSISHCWDCGNTPCDCDSLNIMDVSGYLPADDEQLVLDVNSPFVGQQKLTISLAPAIDQAEQLLADYFDGFELPQLGVSVTDGLEL
jgi:hypothetical protein